MSLEQIIVISGIVGAFVVFAAVLAWGDYQTRHITSRICADQRRRNKVVDTAKVKPELHHEDDLVVPGV